MKHIATFTICMLWSAIVLAANLVVGGDSYSTGVGASVPANAYIPQVVTATGLTLNNQALAGGMACDASRLLYGMTLGAADKGIIQLFANEAHVYLTPAKAEYGRACHLSAILSLAAPTRTNATAMTPSTYTSGSWVAWTSAAPYTNCMQSWLGGSSLTSTFSGTALYVTVRITEPVAGYTLVGAANVLVDGVVVGSVNSDGTGMTTGAGGTTAAPAAYRYAGFSTGMHTASIVMTTDNHTIGGLVQICGITGSDQAVKPIVAVGNIPRWTAAAYASTPGASDSTVLTFAAIANDTAAKTASDGLNTHLVDNYTHLYPPSTYMLDLHPNDAGHLQMKNDYVSALTGSGPPPPPTQYPAFPYWNGTNYILYSDSAGTLNAHPVP